MSTSPSHQQEYTTPFMVLSQREVDVFAALTESIDPTHNSPEWVAEAPDFGPRTIVHGLFVACFIPRWLKEVPNGLRPSTDRSYTLNYGIDKLRWLKPIPVGSEFRAKITAIADEVTSRERRKVTFGIEVYQRSHEAPSMVAVSHLMHIDLRYSSRGTPSSSVVDGAPSHPNAIL